MRIPAKHFTMGLCAAAGTGFVSAVATAAGRGLQSFLHPSAQCGLPRLPGMHWASCRGTTRRRSAGTENDSMNSHARLDTRPPAAARWDCWREPPACAWVKRLSTPRIGSVAAEGAETGGASRPRRNQATASAPDSARKSSRLDRAADAASGPRRTARGCATSAGPTQTLPASRPTAATSAAPAPATSAAREPAARPRPVWIPAPVSSSIPAAVSRRSTAMRCCAVQAPPATLFPNWEFSPAARVVPPVAALRKTVRRSLRACARLARAEAWVALQAAAGQEGESG
jgi:hypothetical protein